MGSKEFEILDKSQVPGPRLKPRLTRTVIAFARVLSGWGVGWRKKPVSRHNLSSQQGY